MQTEWLVRGLRTLYARTVCTSIRFFVTTKARKQNSSILRNHSSPNLRFLLWNITWLDSLQWIPSHQRGQPKIKVSSNRQPKQRVHKPFKVFMFCKPNFHFRTNVSQEFCNLCMLLMWNKDAYGKFPVPENAKHAILPSLMSLIPIRLNYIMEKWSHKWNCREIKDKKFRVTNTTAGVAQCQFLETKQPRSVLSTSKIGTNSENPCIRKTNKASKSNTPRSNQTIGLVARSVRRFRPVWLRSLLMVTKKMVWNP